MSNQVIFAEEPQSEMDLGQTIQNGLTFPQSLAERYEPKALPDFIGLERPKALLKNLIAAPKPCNLLFIGPAGTGKTVAGMALAHAIGSLVHVSAQKCDVASLDALADRLAYSPPTGRFWVVVVDEADAMTEKAQLQLLSRMDTTSSLVPTFGGGFVKGTPLPVIFVFTMNGKGDDGLKVPSTVQPRFVSRCMKLEFTPPAAEEMVARLERVWRAEGGGAVEEGYFPFICRGVGMRDALMRLDTDLLAGPRPVVIEPPAAVRAAFEPGSSDVPEEHQQAARALLGEQAVVWQKGGYYRAGVYTDKEGRYVEEGRLMIGTGSSAKGAVRDAAKRVAAKGGLSN
jgi:hypothetical protein